MAKTMSLLLSVYNAVGWVEISEYKVYWLTGYPLIGHAQRKIL